MLDRRCSMVASGSMLWKLTRESATARGRPGMFYRERTARESPSLKSYKTLKFIEHDLDCLKIVHIIQYLRNH